jgi:mannan polymerase II complex MNN10 subunit
MIIRATPQIFEFFARVRGYHDVNKQFSEQDCLRDVILDPDGGTSPDVLFIPQWKINAFPDEIRCWDRHQRGWEEGMLVAHFAGAWAHIKENDPTGFLMRKYERFIRWP